MSSSPDDERTDRLEIGSAVLLALATVATAWSGYQASRWNGEQAKAFSKANAARIEATGASDLANAQTQIDVAGLQVYVLANGNLFVLTFSTDQPNKYSKTFDQVISTFTPS